MKRILLICFLAPFFCMGQQTPDTTIIGDTIIIGNNVFRKEYPQDTVNYFDSCYYTDNPHSFLLGSGGALWVPNPHVKECIVPSVTNVYGVAVVGQYSITDSIWPTYGIMRKEGDNWIVIDTANFDSYRVVCAYNYGNDVYGHSNPQYCYEYYFDNPVVVGGTIYIGLLNHINYSQARPGSMEYNMAFTRVARPHLIGADTMFTFYSKHPLTNEWISVQENCFGGFFPIVEPDRLLCGAVENFRLEERGDDYAVVAWHPSRPFEGLYSGRYQVAVGGLGPAPDTSNILTFADTTATVTGLDSGVWYSLWVRGECDHGGCPMHGDTLIWSPWRGPLQFYLGSRQPGSQGIAEADGTGTALTLVPNPARGRVAVVLGDGPVRGALTLVDAKGSEVLRLDDAQLPLSLDTSPLAPGVYLLRLSTEAGSYARKLVVGEK